MPLTLRAAKDADADAIWEMLRPVFRAGQTYAIDSGISQNQALAYWLSERAFIAEDDGIPVGTFYIQENRPGGGAHYCNCGFVTAQNVEGRGVARTMLEHALDMAKSLGFEGMVFNFVVESNVRAVRLWQRYDFEIIGRVPGAFRPLGSSKASDALVMFRPL